MNMMIRRVISAVGWTVFGSIVSTVILGCAESIKDNPCIVALLLFVIALVWGVLYFLTASPDQRDMKTNDKKVEVLALKDLDAYHSAGKLMFGKMDAYVACHYRDFGLA